MIDYGLAGRSVLVTGGGSGIGEAIVRLVARSGAAVAVVDISGEQARRVAADVEAEGGRAIAVECDVRDEAAVDRAVAEAMGLTGRLDAAVNNAGTSTPATTIADCTTEAWRRVQDLNVDGLFFCLRAELRAMRPLRSGAVVNIASILGAVARAGSGPYVTSKHAVVGLTRAAALDHATDGIRVNAVGPGHTRTPLLAASVEPDVLAAIERDYPGGRLAAPTEIAGLVAWLLSDAASFVTGGYYPVDGGYLAR